MNLSPNEFYHIYNRGNNRQPIFFSEKNYLFFIKKIRAQLAPVSEIISYCLMPNHFHLIIKATNKSVVERVSFGGKPMQEFAYRIGILLSSYAQAINKQNGSTGSLFQQKTRVKILSEPVEEKIISYLESCLFYIHNNPLRAKLVSNLKDWPYSSWPDYAGVRNGTLCNKAIFFECTGVLEKNIVGWHEENLAEDVIKKFF
jgi:putative transposase